MTETSQQTQTSGKLWGGRFAEQTAASVEAFTESISYDWRLYRHDIMGSKAHTRMLAKQGLISEEERDAITAGLSEIEQEIDEGKFTFREDLEDIHMNIEKALTDKIGAAGEKLHTARSRNDQVALDIRLYLRDEGKVLNHLLTEVQKGFTRLARTNLGAIMPGYTHLQRAQPVLLSHHLLAYMEMFGRDRERIADCMKRINIMPLGSAALAGTGLPVDREFVAEELGFPAVTANSMDTTADRDFAMELLFCLTTIQLHLSRMAEEFVLWASKEFDFIKIGDKYCTGSSIMPQKKNPDIAELARGKSGRLAGNLVSLLTLLKGLPMTYNRDLQEDKEPLFDSVDTVRATVRLTAAMLQHTSINAAACADAASDPDLLATDLADYLVGQKVPFREAHHLVGEVVALAEKRAKPLDQLTLKELQGVSRKFKADALEVFDLKQALAKRTATGSPGTKEVKKQLRRWVKRLG